MKTTMIVCLNQLGMKISREVINKIKDIENWRIFIRVEE